MKFIAVFALIGLLCVNAAPTKEELEQKATELEARLDEEIEKAKTSRPHLVHELEHQKNELKRLAEELEKANDDKAVEGLEVRLGHIEEGIERELSHLDSTGTPPVRPTGTHPTRRPHVTTQSSDETVSP